MKALIKSLLKKILFRNRDAKSFPAIRISNGEIKERVLLKKGSSKLDISDRHCITCHAPFCIGVSLTNEELPIFRSNNVSLLFLTGEQVDARLTLTFKLSHTMSERQVLIFEARSARCFQINSLHQFFIRRYFKNKNTKSEDKMYAAAYSYPRRVITVSYLEKDYYTIFPMDFQCFIKESNIYILGLRTTNVALPKILNTKNLVISDTNSAAIDDIYFLGKHHSAEPPAIDQLPFKVSQSQLLNFPIPDFAAAYKEIEIVKNYKLGSHMLLIGNVINDSVETNPISSLYHIHFFQSIKSSYTFV